MRAISAALVLSALATTEVRAQEPATESNQSSEVGSLSEQDRRLLAEAEAEAEAAEVAEVIIIEAEQPYVPVASRSVRDRDFNLRPRPRPADILRVVPGVFVNQHAGGGKANQYFLRGFDADHGTDIALSFDGIPANLVSHGHGQGYADLNWVIPELVASVDTVKGPYAAGLGDFATAGAIDLVVHDGLKTSSAALSTGRFGSYRGVAVVSPEEIAGWRPLIAAELSQVDGPFVNEEGYRRYSVHGQASRELGTRTTIKLAATSYMGAWRGSGQLPLREVEAGRLDRFGSLDPSEGGDSERHSAYAVLQTYPSESSELHALAYVVRSRLNMFSNFTFFLADPEMGDQIEQEDDRVYAGVKTRYRVAHPIGPFKAASTAGLSWRGDLISTGLWDASERERLAARVDADIAESALGVYGQEDIEWTPWLRSVAGLRLDYFAFDVADQLGDGSGTHDAARIGPKGSLVITPTQGTDLYVNAGIGFHSNDARAVVREMDPGTPLTRAFGAELGARSRIADRVDIAGSLWLLDLENEIVWVGDEGVTESRGPTRRVGVELEARAEILSWLTADADLTLSRARFRDAPKGADSVPLAPSLTFTAGLSAQHPSGVFGRLGSRGLSDRPLTEDAFLTAEGFTLFDLTAGYRTSRYEVTLAIDNLLDTKWREAQFATASRLPTDPSTSMPPPANACSEGTRVATAEGNFAGCEDVHFTPGSPLNAMLTAKLFF